MSRHFPSGSWQADKIHLFVISQGGLVENHFQHHVKAGGKPACPRAQTDHQPAALLRAGRKSRLLGGARRSAGDTASALLHVPPSWGAARGLQGGSAVLASIRGRSRFGIVSASPVPFAG